MILYDLLRVEHEDQRLVLRERGLAIAMVRILFSGFWIAVGCFVVAVLTVNVAQGVIRPSEPTAWYTWLLFAVFAVLFTGALGGVPIWIGTRFALRDYFTIDSENRSLTAWRGLYFVRIRQECYALSLFSEVAMRPHANRGMGGTTWHWAVSLEGEKLVKLVSVDDVEHAESVAGEISRAAALPVHLYSRDSQASAVPATLRLVRAARDMEPFVRLALVGATIAGALWVRRYLRRKHGSLRELFLLVAYWCAVSACYAAVYR